MKKLISIVLCLAMLMSCFALFASAADPAEAAAEVHVIDGAISEGEYTNSKVYESDASLQWQNSNAAVQITEYGAQDADYVYFALVYEEAMSKVEIMINGSEGVRYDWDAAKLYDWFTFADIDETGVAGSYTAYNFGEVEQTSFAKTTDGKTVVEIKMSKESMKTAYGVDSVDAFAYYADSWRVSDNAKVRNATFLDNGEMDEHFSSREWGIWFEYYNVDGVSEWYPNNCVLANVVVLTGEELAETPALYCPDDEDCAVEGHANRATKLDLADLRDFGLIPGLYVDAYVPPIDYTKPVADGVIGTDEYTNSKVYESDASLQWQWTGSKGVSITEYGAQDADYVYFALEFDAEMSALEVYFDASAGIRYDWDGMQDYDWFTFSGINADGVAGSYGVWAGGTIEQTSIAKITDGKTIVEIKMSKESVKTAFGLDSFDAFAYYVNGAALADGSGSIGNYTYLDNAEMDEHFSGREWGIWFEYYNVDGVSEWYPDNCILGNIVVLTGEELPETPAFYCPAGDDCTVEGHANRATKLDLADLRDFGLIPGLYVENMDAPKVDAIIDEEEYTASKVYDADASLQFQWNGSKGVTITEYASHDAHYVYFALEFDAEMSLVEVYMNGSEGVRYDWDAAKLYGWFTFNGIDADGVAGAHTGYNFGALDQTSVAKIVDGKTIVEIKITKESMKSAFGVDTVEAFAYYVEGTLADGSGMMSNKTWIDNSEMDEHFTGREWGIWGHYYEDGVGEWYPEETVLANIVVFNDTLPETAAFYCPAGDDCTVEGHANRAAVLDVADLRDFGLLPGLFVESYDGSEEKAPMDAALDGVISDSEYTASKLYADDRHFTANYVEGVTVTEYVRQDANYVYIALVYNAAMSKVEIRLTADQSVRTGIAATETAHVFAFDFSAADTAIAVGNKKYAPAAFAANSYQGYGVVADGTTTVELKVSKIEMKKVYGTSTLDCIGYYGEATTAEGAAVTNAMLISEDELTAYGEDVTGYKNRIANVIVLTDETRPETATEYDPDAAEGLDFADLRAFDKLPATFIASADHYVAEDEQPEETEPEVTDPEVTEPEETEPELPESVITDPDEPVTSTVKGTYVQGDGAPVTYSVDVVFGSMAFTFTADQKTWDAENHVEVDSLTGAWTCDTNANKITVTNHSNVAVSATLEYIAESGYTGITGEFDDAELALNTAVGTPADEAPTASAYLTIDGEYARAEGSVKVGTVKVTIVKAE